MLVDDKKIFIIFTLKKKIGLGYDYGCIIWHENYKTSADHVTSRLHSVSFSVTTLNTWFFGGFLHLCHESITGIYCPLLIALSYVQLHL